MKRILLLILMSLGCFSSFSQVALTTNGLVSIQDESKGFLVFEYENINQSELFNSVLHFIQKTYKSPKDVVSSIGTESISFRGAEAQKIGLPYQSKIDQKMLGKYASKFDITYNILVQFKDNKIRVDIPTYECSRILNGGKKAMLLTIGKNAFLSDDIFIYSSKDGKLKQEDVKAQLEHFFNDLIDGIKESPYSKKEDNSEW